jgi:hypothetical protein
LLRQTIFWITHYNHIFFLCVGGEGSMERGAERGRGRRQKQKVESRNGKESAGGSFE